MWIDYKPGIGDITQNDSHSRDEPRGNEFSVSFDSFISTPNIVVNLSQYPTFTYFLLQWSRVNFYQQPYFMLI